MTPPPLEKATPADERQLTFASIVEVVARACGLVWDASRRLTLVFGFCSLTAGLIPVAVAYLGKLIIDGIVTALETGAASDLRLVLIYVLIEGLLAATLLASRRGLTICQQLLRALLSQRVNEMILEKALTLNLVQFEDSEIYDKMTRARREASSKPLSLVKRTFAISQNALSLLSYGGLLIAFSVWAVVALTLAALPAFLAEARFAKQAFRIFQWRTPDARQRAYLEAVIARDDYAKEVMLFGIGPLLLQRYRDVFERLFAEDRSLTLRRGFWGIALNLLSTCAFYGAYAWIAWVTMTGRISLGDMTMYLMVFRQGQNAFSQVLADTSGIYEDNLYLTNLYDFLDQPAPESNSGGTVGQSPGDGIRFEGVSFTYPGASHPTIHQIDLHLPAGRRLALVGHNGSGKTTLIKLMCGLYTPQQGQILLDGLALNEWDQAALYGRMAVIFQDFVHYQMLVGENIGLGDPPRVQDEEAWARAADRGMASEFIEEMDRTYHTQLGRWFPGGRELSVGQWQKIALSRAFMREGGDILVLDEPTSAMDAEAEAHIFERVRQVTRDSGQIAVLISHRFSTVRMADHIVVLDKGAIAEEGSHETLMAQAGIYARLFTLQAESYR